MRILFVPFQQFFIESYLESLPGGVVTEDEVAKIQRETEYFAMASHLLWTSWSIVQVNVSQIAFDYTVSRDCCLKGDVRLRTLITDQFLRYF
jgi:hypothetical protein